MGDVVSLKKKIEQKEIHLNGQRIGYVYKDDFPNPATGRVWHWFLYDGDSTGTERSKAQAEKAVYVAHRHALRGS